MQTATYDDATWFVTRGPNKLGYYALTSGARRILVHQCDPHLHLHQNEPDGTKVGTIIGVNKRSALRSVVGRVYAGPLTERMSRRPGLRLFMTSDGYVLNYRDHERFH